MRYLSFYFWNHLKKMKGQIISLMHGVEHFMYPQGPPITKRVFALRIAWKPANKSCPSGWVCLVKFDLWRSDPNQWPPGSIPPKGGSSFWAIILIFGRLFLFHMASVIGSPLPYPFAHSSTPHLPLKKFLFSSLDQPARL